MRRPIPLLLIFLFSCNQHPKPTEQKQPDTPQTKTTIPTKPSLISFAPEGYTILDSTTGDLNLDSFPDVVLILHKDHEDTITDDLPRPLLLLTGQPNGSLKLSARNDSAVDCYRCGGLKGDPYQQTVIKKGFFSLEFFGGSSETWTRIVTFKYAVADNTWYLHKISEDASFPRNPDLKEPPTIWSKKHFGTISFTKYNSDSVYNILADKQLK